MEKLKIPLPQREYEIFIGEGILNNWREILQFDGIPLVVSDENIWALYGDAFSGLPHVIIPPGEGSKSLHTLSRLYDEFSRAGINRGSLIIALGGGVVGDLCGFAAATWMRGIDYVQIPTSLIAQVDSSIGGKTAINLHQGKNLAGAFHQPKAVIVDTGLLKSLPEREFKSGMGEIIKYGAIYSREFFEELKKPLHMPEIIKTCCELKAKAVILDERDTGERVLLNFGHSFGHAIEAIGGFEKHSHGEAVSFGMVIAARLGEKMGITAKGTAQDILELLSHHGIAGETDYPPASLLPYMKLDKKGADGGIGLVLLDKIGSARTVQIGYEDLEQWLKKL